MLKRLVAFICVLAIAASLCGFLSVYFLKPFLKEKLLDAAKGVVGRDIQFTEFDVGLLSGVIFFKEVSIRNVECVRYCNSLAVDTIRIDISYIKSLIQKSLIFENVSIEGLAFTISSKTRSSPPDAGGTIPVEKTHISRIAEGFSAPAVQKLFIKRLSLRDGVCTFENYSFSPSPHRIKIGDIDAEIRNFVFFLGQMSRFSGDIELSGRFEPIDRGGLFLKGSFSRDVEGCDFDIKLTLENTDLIQFSPYYARTSFAILKKAMFDLRSRAICEDDRLNAKQRVRIYDIALNKIEPTDDDTFFKLPAKTVVKFFKDMGGEVSFGFDVVGTLADPKFDPGPVVRDILINALRDKIVGKLRELPREFIKIGEKAIKEGWERGEELKRFEKELDKVKKKFEKLIE